MSDPIKAIILGAGGRGQNTYGKYALQNPGEIQCVAVADPDDRRRAEFVHDHKVKEENIFTDWKEVFKREKFADLVCVCTQDQMHTEPALAAIEMGYDLLLEKPIAPTYEECTLIADAAKKKGVSVAVAHVLRYTPFFESIKKVIDSGELGKVVGIDHRENVGNIHYSHSFVRGNWHSEAESTPMILAKCCHDLDILLYLTGSNCKSLSSYGTKGYFSSKNRPKDAPHRCLDGCPHRKECPYYGPKIYLTGDVGWPTNILTTDLTTEGITEALKTGPYGVCVFDCDNDMTEHQLVSMNFDNNITVALTMSAFTQETSRTIKVMMEKGEIIGEMIDDELQIINFETREKRVISHVKLHSDLDDTHGGGDEGFTQEIIAHLRDKENFPLNASIEKALQSHKLAFAAQKAMEEGTTINF